MCQAFCTIRRIRGRQPRFGTRQNPARASTLAADWNPRPDPARSIADPASTPRNSGLHNRFRGTGVRSANTNNWVSISVPHWNQNRICKFHGWPVPALTRQAIVTGVRSRTVQHALRAASRRASPEASPQYRGCNTRWHDRQSGRRKSSTTFATLAIHLRPTQ
jgi:hypothetical protein